MFLLSIGVPEIVIAVKKGNLPMDEMVSRGVVAFEVRENVWRHVEPSHFPVLKETGVKTEKGSTNITRPAEGRSRVQHLLDLSLISTASHYYLLSI